MPELWLPEEDRHAFWDAPADEVRVIGWRPGPAGVSTVELASGLTVAVDHASPTTLTEVAVELEGGRMRRDHQILLAALLGDEAVRVLSRLPGSTSGERPVPLRPDDGLDAHEPWRRRREGDPVQERFAHLVVAVDLGDDADRPDLARGVALLEAAAIAAELHPALVPRLVERAVDLLASAPAATDRVLAVRVQRLAAGLVRAVDPIVARKLSDAAERLVREGGAPLAWDATVDALPAAMAAPPAAARAAPPSSREAHREEPLGSPGTVPLEVEGSYRAWAGLTPGANVVVTAGGGAEGAWARVFRRSDRLLLGLAPVRVRAGQGQGSAVVVVPPTPADDLVVDLVDDPAVPRRDGVHDEVRRAVRRGREAARFSRLGDDIAAEAAWSECAERWRRLGDVQRANLADRQGRRDDIDRMGSAPRVGRPRLLSDQVE